MRVVRILRHDFELTDRVDLRVKEADAEYSKKITFGVSHRSLNAHLHSSLTFREVLDPFATSGGRSRGFFPYTARLPG